MSMTMAEIVARMNWLAAQDESTRQRLRDECKVRGHHLPTGERVMVNPPIDNCYHCGAEFRES